MTAPSLPSQIDEINDASDLLAANAGTIVSNGWGAEMDRAQIALGRQRALLEYVIRCGIEDGEALRKALAKSGSESP